MNTPVCRIDCVKQQSQGPGYGMRQGGEEIACLTRRNLKLALLASRQAATLGLCFPNVS